MALAKMTQPFGIIVYKTGSKPTRQGTDTPVEALVLAITYLRRGYHVLLTDPTVGALAEQEGTIDLEWLGHVRGVPARNGAGT